MKVRVFQEDDGCGFYICHPRNSEELTVEVPDQLVQDFLETEAKLLKLSQALEPFYDEFSRKKHQKLWDENFLKSHNGVVLLKSFVDPLPGTQFRAVVTAHWGEIRVITDDTSIITLLTNRGWDAHGGTLTNLSGVVGTTQEVFDFLSNL